MIKVETLLDIDKNLSLDYGNPSIVSGISSYLSPQESSLVFVKSKKYLNELGRLNSCDSNKYSLITTSKLFEEYKSQMKSFKSILVTKNFSRSMTTLSKPFYDLKYKDLNFEVDGRQMGESYVDSFADVAQNVFIGENVTIEKNVKIMSGAVVLPNCHIGEGTIIFPNVTLYPFTQIGKNCRIHSGTVIGSDGFGYNFIDGKHEKIWHLYGVKIGNDVEIGSNSCIDSGCFIETFIDDGCRIDNQVHISHNARVGKHCVLCGKSGLAGSCELEDYVVFAAGAGAAPNARIGSGSQIAAAAVVSENALIPPKSILAGHPARPLKEWLRTKAKIKKLTEQ